MRAGVTCFHTSMHLSFFQDICAYLWCANCLTLLHIPRHIPHFNFPYSFVFPVELDEQTIVFM